MTYENPTRPDGTGPGTPDADAPAPPPWLQFAPPTAAPQRPPAAAPAPPAPRGSSARPDSGSPARETMPPRPDFESRSAPPPDHPAAVRPPADHAGAADHPGAAPADPHPHGGPVPPEPRPEISPTENPVAPPWPPQAPPVPGPDHFGPDNLGPGHVTGPAPSSGMPPHPAASQIVPPAPPAPQSAPAWSAQPGMPPTPVAGHQPPPYAGPAPMGPGPAPAFPGQPMQHGYGPPSGGPSLDEVALIRKARRAPSRGWRRAVHTLSAGAINPGESQGDIEYQQLLERVNRPVRGDYRIAVLSLKGGVGKTTTTVGLGSTFASLRGDRVIAVDANPDLGTLAQRIPQQTRSTVRDLLADENVYRYSDVRAHTSQAPSRLEVLASERDPAMAEAFNEEEYRGVITVLQRFYNIIITDCGTGLSHSAMNGVLDLANTIILVSSPALDGARSAGATLDWLEAHGFGHLVSRAVVVLSSSRPGSSTIDTDQLGQHFLTRCRAVHKIPFDDHLAEGADVDLELMSKPTKRSFVELAATIADDFSGGPGQREEPFLR
ncbi:AAA family ATPase [Gordonia sp. AC31]|uniref:MinD/ParA family ATP-binding protein n=1 Tax=Gordonia sp. AC31 TaxID=2962571 RepID=UPI00288248E0|nr:AAA family ATPase [Gordonia sp. AC31]MDT0222237.1 AAA family ATPase [Gordonia sp. AC31]